MRKPMSRRSFLRGSGVSIALPALEAMLPSKASAATTPPLRFISIFFANGAVQNGTPGTAANQWESIGNGTTYTLSAAMQPLAPHKADIIPVHGLKNASLDYARDTLGDGSHDHQYGPLAFLSGQPARLSNYQLVMPGSSIDQMMGATTALPVPVYYLGAQPERGDGLIGRSHVSWASQTQLVPRIETTLNAFNKLFGNGGGAQTRLDFRKSILDNVLADAQSLNSKLGTTDANRLKDFMDSVREVERRIAAEVALSCVIPAASIYSENSANDATLMEMRSKNMLDLITLALQCDLSRVITFMLDNEENFTLLRDHGGIQATTDPGHHYDSHYTETGYGPNNVSQRPANHLKFNQWQTGKLAYLMQKLKDNKDADGSQILDHSMILFGTSLGDSQQHSHNNVCTILAGKANGLLNPGRVMRYNNVPRENLLLTLLRKWGINSASVGLSTGIITDI